MDFKEFGKLPLDVQKEIIFYSPVRSFSLSLVSKFFNEWAIPLKITELTIGVGCELSDECLIKIQKTLKSLDLRNSLVSDKQLQKLKNLTNIYMRAGNKLITVKGLKSVALNLKHATLDGIKVADEILRYSHNLTSLELRFNNSIDGHCMQYLTNLKSLKVFYSNINLSECMSNLSSTLEHLYLQGATSVTNDCISKMSYLSHLSLGSNRTITNEGLTKLTNLKFLDLSFNDTITDEGLIKLTSLTDLDLNFNNVITNKGIDGLNNLKYLSLVRNTVIKKDEIPSHLFLC